MRTSVDDTIVGRRPGFNPGCAGATLLTVTETADDTRAPLPLEEVARAVLALTAERTLEGFAARFLETLRLWAAPSAVLAAVRDPAAGGGWRLLPALSSGSGPLAAERSVRQLIEEMPEDLARPSLVRPGREIPGVRTRENCLVPWSCEGESGVLMLRGVAPPCPPNLADAVALLSAALWPRLLGGPASRVETSVAELRRLADRLREDADRQIERLQAARPPSGAEPPPAGPAGPDRLAELEQQVAAARSEARRLSALVESLRSEHGDAVAQLLEERRATMDSKAVARAADEALSEVRKELAGAEEGTARLILEREEFRQQVTSLEKALGEAEEERDEIRRETSRLADRLRSLEAAGRAGTDEGAASRAAGPEPGAGGSVEVFRRALAVLRRTPFLPPPLRVAVQEAEAAVGEKDQRPERWARIAVLDRDTAGLEPLAAELESAGLDVKIASHPEELALLLKTPEGRDLDAAICDVLAFRPDQNLAGIFRGWEKDRPGLALYLTFGPDSPPEVERAQRVPLSLTKGRFQRPLKRRDLMEMLEPLRRPAP
jgi:hypothetical protein